MKKNTFEKSFGKMLDELHEREAREGVYGYALFDTVKRAFVTFIATGYATYTGDIEEAYIADSRPEAYLMMVERVDDYLDTKVVAVVENELFGLSPKPGALDDNDDDYIRIFRQ